jgi:hypothetical protein
MNQPERSPESFVIEQDAIFRQQVDRLHHLTVYGRWLFVLGLWLTVGTLSLWGLRYPIELIHEYFTWAAVYYGLHFHPLPTIGLATCIAFTTAVLVWQSRNILLGLPKRDRERLERQVLRIRKQGRSHPLWKYVCQDA